MNSVSVSAFDATRILYHDDDLIAVNKPAGALVVADRWGKEPNILLHQVGAFLRAQGHQPDASGRDLYPVHRLDRDTSGVVLFAKQREAHRTLSRMFEGREIAKVYWLLAAGCPPMAHLSIDAPLSRREGKRGRGRGYVDRVNGKPSVTNFRVLQYFGDICWFEAQPLTGRLHQIRLHAAELGYPALYDPQYGRTTWVSAQWGEITLTHVPLHARELQLPHPRTAQPLRITAAPDDEFRRLVERLAVPSTR